MDLITLIQGKNATQTRKVIYTFILDVVSLQVNQPRTQGLLLSSCVKEGPGEMWLPDSTNFGYFCNLAFQTAHCNNTQVYCHAKTLNYL